ncbi:hypothetical protein XI06_07345 [Bradyrhizobium sp. CCBAU 11434]|uniref:hypothetical protein n=1 Tax=Bradyrhizobium sp. CCBAU 11434 TaxID=1630885 RepID=UPI002306A690|nr:hypothetical protein [Bradyrhizobium sp. CCBAU 11434]MDA9520169.1 hypothetical protein [Bradyrhizobium sp. CCBAU 11434]
MNDDYNYLNDDKKVSAQVRDLAVRFQCQDTVVYGEAAITGRLAIGREAYEILEPKDFHDFFRRIVLADAMEKIPELQKRSLVIVV